jgi:hypothetical protein
MMPPSFLAKPARVVRPQEGPTTTTPTTTTNDTNSGRHTLGISILGRVIVFLGFPMLVGMSGLYTAYLEAKRKPERKLSFDLDFVVPFLLALALSVLIGFQTNGFTTQEIKPIVSWPKVRRVKTIVKKKKGSAVKAATEDDDNDSGKLAAGKSKDD